MTGSEYILAMNTRLNEQEPSLEIETIDVYILHEHRA